MEKLKWIKVCAQAPYFEDEDGHSWTPIGQNDALTWPELQGIFLRKNIKEAEEYLAYLSANGVTCLRIMLEYCQTENRYLERPAGNFQRNMVQFWDDLFMLCEKYKLRLLLTPFDTFWMARRWNFHPYNVKNGGPCKSKWQWLSSDETRSAIKNRFSFVIRRWGGSGVIFGWDLWNELHPRHNQKRIEGLSDFITDVGTYVKNLELELFGKRHLQTVSVFAPDLHHYDMHDIVFKHPALDFASTHLYKKPEIDSPRNSFDAACVTGEMVMEALVHTPASKPFLDSEHGPIDYFRRNRKNLPEAFDDAYFLTIQWAHLASGAAGGGMRWPYRHPHTLTHGMRCAQKNLAEFVKLIRWKEFDRKNLVDVVRVDDPSVTVFSCGNSSQIIVWLLQRPKRKKGTKNQDLSIVSIPDLANGNYSISLWDTKTGLIENRLVTKTENLLNVSFEMKSDNIALAVTSIF